MQLPHLHIPPSSFSLRDGTWGEGWVQLCFWLCTPSADGVHHPVPSSMGSRHLGNVTSSGMAVHLIFIFLKTGTGWHVEIWGGWNGNGVPNGFLGHAKPGGCPWNLQNCT